MGTGGRSVKVAAYLHLLSRLRMGVSVITLEATRKRKEKKKDKANKGIKKEKRRQILEVK
jgi:hypothetical protein